MVIVCVCVRVFIPGALLALAEVFQLRLLIAVRNCGGGSWINTVERYAHRNPLLPRFEALLPHASALVDLSHLLGCAQLSELT